MDKINFINNSQPALNATNMNKLQDNVEDAIGTISTGIQDELDLKLNKSSVKTSKTTSTTDTYSCNYINDIENKFLFSKNETRVGTWVNNKPLYRKVIEKTYTSTIGASGNVTNLSVDHNISNIGIRWCGSAFNASGGQLPGFGGTNNVSMGACVNTISTTAINFRIVNDTYAPNTWYFVLYYTKTTD